MNVKRSERVPLVVISGCRVSGFKTGISIEYAPSALVEDCKILGAETGIELNGVKEFSARNVTHTEPEVPFPVSALSNAIKGDVDGDV